MKFGGIDMVNDKPTLNFFFEMAMLKRIKHEGWRVVGVETPDSVAEHALRAAQIAYFLACEEGHPEPEKASLMLVFHDMAEARVGDMHKIAKRYVMADELAAVRDQTDPLGEPGRRIRKLWEEFEARETSLAKIAKDADLLEQALAAKEYMERGYKFADDFINNIKKILNTKTALRWMKQITRMNSNDWWQGLKKLEPQKRK
ncbi:MAG TPA: HD domain-containing protein [archaeon]|nr:HD domain-containing protein [archaeon]